MTLHLPSKSKSFISSDIIYPVFIRFNVSALSTLFLISLIDNVFVKFLLTPLTVHLINSPIKYNSVITHALLLITKYFSHHNYTHKIHRYVMKYSTNDTRAM